MNINTLLNVIERHRQLNAILWVESIGEETLKNTLVQIAADEKKLSSLTRAVYELDRAFVKLTEGNT